MRIFIDFDNVIFNTPRFKRALAAAFKKNGASAKDFTDTYERAKNGGCYSPQRHLQLLVKEKYISDAKRMRQDMSRVTDDVSAFVFRDAYMFFTRHGKKSLCLLSFGDPAFQKKKITGSGVRKYFSKIIITKGDKGAEIGALRRVNLPHKNIVFIDDSDTHIREAERIPGVITIQLLRNKAIHKSSVADYHVSTLAQASKIIESS